MSRAEFMRTVGSLQRRMPRHLFSVLSILLLLLGCACGSTYAGDDAPVKSVTLFAPGRTKVPEKVGDTMPTKDAPTFIGPLLSSGSGVMVAVVDVWYTEGLFRSVDVVTKYIVTEGKNWADKTTENNGGNWKIQLAMQRKEEEVSYTTKSLGAVIKGNKIYLLALTGEGSEGFLFLSHWYLELFVGEILGGGANKTIEWRPSELLHSKLTQEIENRGLHVVPDHIFSAFLTSKRTIVFGVDAMNKKNESVIAIMRLKDDEEQWEVSFFKDQGLCLFVSFFEWKEKLISILTGYWGSGHYVMEYDEVSKEWKDFSGTLFRSGQKLSSTMGFTTASIENKTVLLYTEAYANVTFADALWEIRLWVTDGSYFYDAGVIATEYAKVVSWGLLYTNGELFSLHQRTRGWSEPIVFTRLNCQLSAIRSKMKVWHGEEVYLPGSSLLWG